MRVKRFNENLLNFFGLTLFLVIGAKHLVKFGTSASPYLLLLGVRACVVATLFSIRDRPKKRASHIKTSLTYFMSGLPLLYEANHGASSLLPHVACWAMLVGGNILAIAGLLTLGRSFGVSPAARTRVTNGIYGILAHPIYVGYSIAELGFATLIPTIRNGIILCCSLTAYFLRARMETRILSERP